MKRIAAFALAFLLVFSFSVPCFAEQRTADQYSYTWQLNDEITVVTTIEKASLKERATTGGSKTNDYYYLGSHIATMVLNGSFYYDGSTARATEASKSYSTASGWSYSGGDAKTSGASVTISGSFNNGLKSCTVDMTLTCSPSGVLS